MGLGVETNPTGGWRVVLDGRELAVGRANAYKPYIHPLNTLAGDCLTVDAPWDHTWHRGLYFAWKYLAGANAWGEGDEEPSRRSARARVVSERAAAMDDGAQVNYEIAWEALAPDEPLLAETRTLRFWLPTGSPGYYGLDWSARFTAQTRVELERSTPVDAKRGGYAGLSWRP
ncbi:MAG TPA: DUF6807 family protein, partial [Limnochordia bacterium]|nr:DUF6807 family protein [Limnochordia bacterium]